MTAVHREQICVPPNTFCSKEIRPASAQNSILVKHPDLNQFCNSISQWALRLGLGLTRWVGEVQDAGGRLQQVRAAG